MATSVVFRKYKSDGSIIALFPGLPASNYGADITSYQHIGQHGAASPFADYDTVLATPEEYGSLLSELKQIGYDDLVVRTRIVRTSY